MTSHRSSHPLGTLKLMEAPSSSSAAQMLASPKLSVGHVPSQQGCPCAREALPKSSPQELDLVERILHTVHSLDKRRPLCTYPHTCLQVCSGEQPGFSNPFSSMPCLHPLSPHASLQTQQGMPTIQDRSSPLLLACGVSEKATLLFVS